MSRPMNTSSPEIERIFIAKKVMCGRPDNTPNNEKRGRGCSWYERMAGKQKVKLRGRGGTRRLCGLKEKQGGQRGYRVGTWEGRTNHSFPVDI